MNTNPFPTVNTSGEKMKSYWNRPGGKFGTFIGLILLGIIGYYAVPIMTQIVWNTINFAIACAVGFLLFMFLTNKKLWYSIFYLYEILMKKLVGIVIELDPFVIAEDYIRDIEDERQHLYDKSVEVDSQKEEIAAKISEKQKEKDHQLSIASAAQLKGMSMEVANATRQISRLDSYIKQLSPIKDNLTKIGDYLTQVYKNSKYMLDDMKNDLDLKKDLYKSVTKGNNALKSAMSIFQGNPDKQLMLEQSMDFLKEDMATKLASMKKAISYSADFMKSIDLENASYETEGLKMLEEYNPALFQYKNNDGNTIQIPLPTPQPNLNSKTYDNLLS